MGEGREAAEAQASREASEWLVLVQEEPDDQALKRRFEDWLKASPTNVDAWKAVRHVSAVARAMQPEFADHWQPLVEKERAAAARDAPGRRPVNTRRTTWSRRRWALASTALAIAACLALVAASPLLVRLQSDHATGTAEQRKLELEDGSEITLAARSAIAVSYEADGRRIRLLAGEAFFNVVPDPRRPFRVMASTVEATVLGTSFDVRLEAHGATIAVAEGTVEVGSAVRGAPPPERLAAGQAARVSPEGHVSRIAVASQLIASWRRGQLYLHDRTLGDAVELLRPYYAGSIVLADAALAERRVTGVYNLRDPEDALLGMARAHGARVWRITPWLIVLSSS